MESTIFKEVRAEGRRDLVGDQVRRRLGKCKKTDALLARLRNCSPDTVEKIAMLVVESKKKDLVAALDRLLPKSSGAATE